MSNVECRQFNNIDEGNFSWYFVITDNTECCYSNRSVDNNKRHEKNIPDL